MAQELLMFDPALLLWDRNDYTARKGEYWALAGDLMVLFDVMEEGLYKIVLSPAVAEEILDAFPSEQIASDTELHDFVSAVYLFLANRAGSDFLITAATSHGCVPDLIDRAFFPQLVRDEVRAILAMLFTVPPHGHIVSSRIFWGSAAHAAVEAENAGIELPAWLCADDYEKLRNRLRRIYEKHDKHHPDFGYGSRLPKNLKEQQIQIALDRAIELNGHDCLVARAGDGVVLIFRRHGPNKYHAYPVKPNEYSKYAINPAIFASD